MAIDFLSSTAIKAMPENVANTRSVKRGADYSQTAAKSENVARKYSSDEVALTNEAKSLSEATAQAKANDGVDYEKVAALQKQIEEGTFQIDYMSTARKFLAFESAMGL